MNPEEHKSLMEEYQRSLNRLQVHYFIAGVSSILGLCLVVIIILLGLCEGCVQEIIKCVIHP
jgi:hypothetical protein